MINRQVKVGIQMAPQFGDMDRYRDAWMAADALGVDRIYTADHFHAQIVTKDVIKNAEHSATADYGNNFEATVVQAAMAATTSHAEIGCLVHANSYRNPNLMADIARTIDHVAGGRFILGIGAGYLRPDYDEYGYEYGTAKSRMLDLARDVPIIKARLGKLKPPPLRSMPILIAAMGEAIGMRIAAEHASIWHLYGDIEKMEQKCDAMKGICTEVGRDHEELEIATNYFPDLGLKGDPDSYVGLGISHVIVTAFGPDWDLGLLREMLAWRDRVNSTAHEAQSAKQ